MVLCISSKHHVHWSLHDNTAVLAVLVDILYKIIKYAFCNKSIQLKRNLKVQESWKLSATAHTYYYARVVQNGRECLLVQH